MAREMAIKLLCMFQCIGSRCVYSVDFTGAQVSSADITACCRWPEPVSKPCCHLGRSASTDWWLSEGCSWSVAQSQPCPTHPGGTATSLHDDFCVRRRRPWSHDTLWRTAASAATVPVSQICKWLTYLLLSQRYARCDGLETLQVTPLRRTLIRMC